MVKHTQNNSSAKADKLFECVWPFCRVGAEMTKAASSKCSVEKVFLVVSKAIQ